MIDFDLTKLSRSFAHRTLAFKVVYFILTNRPANAWIRGALINIFVALLASIARLALTLHVGRPVLEASQSALVMTLFLAVLRNILTVVATVAGLTGTLVRANLIVASAILTARVGLALVYFCFAVFASITRGTLALVVEALFKLRARAVVVAVDCVTWIDLHTAISALLLPFSINKLI